MARRLPSQPPNLPGFSYIRVLGSGGFADVFLYEQNMPRRQVAVKVMLAEVVTGALRQMFQAEADVMAQLSSHPSILTVYQAGVSSDGRPYLVMEVCSAALSRRYRTEPVNVSEVLAIGIKIASAVETAHRAGVLHRDIKPSNILITAYGHPVLSDFGIAATLGEAELMESVGLSIPWSAPEVLLDETSGTVASEIFSLGSTVFSLLAGRSPFEIPGKENTSAELISRITKGKPHPTGRTDVPASLEAALARAMSRRPEARPSSALEFVRELQSVEAELGLLQTPAEVAVDDWALVTAADPEDRTRARGVASINPSGPGRRRAGRPAPAAVTVTPHPSSRESGSGVRGTALAGAGVAAGRRTRLLAWGVIGCSVLAIVLGVTAAVVLVRVSSASQIPTVTDVSSRVQNGSILFTWADPGLAASDAYQVSVGNGPASIQHANEFRVDSPGGKPVCITVTVNRDGKSGLPSNQKCATPGS